MSEKQLEKLYYSIYPMNQCETQSKSYEETKELCETLEKEMISLMSPDLQAMFEDYKIADGLEISVIEFLDIEIENEADLIAMLKKISPFFKWDGLLHVLEGEKFL